MSEWKETEIGVIPSDWEIKTLNDIADITKLAGFEFTKYFQYIENGEIIALRALNVRDGVLDLTNIKTVSKTASESLERSKLYKNDLLFTYVGANIGQFALVDENNKYHLAPNICRLRAKEKLHYYFLFCFVRTSLFKQILNGYIVGSSQPTLPMSNIRKIPIPLPSLEEQKRIANVLSCLDAKIENLRKQNNTLEQIAQTLFKHWFIDFEFPNTDGKPYKSSGGEMQSSVLGDIPKGWRVGKLGEYLNIKHGYAFKGEYITTEETDKILLTPVNFKIDGGFNDSKYKYYSDEYYPDEYILKKKDLTVTMTDLSKEGDTLGYPAFIPDVNGKVFLHNQRIGRIENNTINKTFLYFLLCRREYRSHILGTASGSTVRHTSPSRICEYIFAIPHIQVIDKFSAIATVTIDKILINFNQIQTLTKIRDALLPKLMSGQIRIEE